ncbi:hypothetical protein AKJ55_00975 [candidate division MSBL1 archaeon SCGC-AAA382M17]|uniref:DUF1616 domain-containing protein n=1 Tax=candidate division MSBL1 archaeon SCGC-AAA382M17 TaxID=1698284 RepID=A0ABR5TJM4_9EURY|nr:hypothetical protein AKJ55_00975 [candidate division MSBL1 archaeon SCGC-AAA382M17]
MRPVSTENEQNSNFHLIKTIIIVIAIVIGIVVALYYVGTGTDHTGEGENQKPYFSKARLQNVEISPKENSLLIAQVANPGDSVYEDIKIRFSTFSQNILISPTNPKVEREYENEVISEQKTEYSLTISDPLGLGKQEKTRTYTFEINGSLPEGSVSMTVKINSFVITDGETTDNKVFELTISSEE